MPTLGRRRALGQHFLKDRGICERIVGAALEFPGNSFLEIGPGGGALTLPLIESLQSREKPELVLAERDARIVEQWRSRELPPWVRIEAGDFLDLPEERWLKDQLFVVSNLPYSAGTAILTRLALHRERVAGMVLMFQAEVAQRVRAEPESKAWGSLSVWIQNAWDVKRLLSVHPGAFNPPPEVDSEVVVLSPRSQLRLPRTQGENLRWESLLKHAFAHRRKMLRSGLPKQGPLRNALEASGVDGTKRAEALSWDDWERLFAALLATHARTS